MKPVILILWTSWSGYMHACWNKLSQQSHLFVSISGASDDAPFDIPLNAQYSLKLLDDYSVLHEYVSAFSGNLDLVLVCGIHVHHYMRIVAELKTSSSVKISLCFDWSWFASPRNVIKALFVSFLKRKLFDFVFVPGERQVQYAINSGFSFSQIKTGLYTCDSNEDELIVDWNKRYNRFVFVGRHVLSKGILQLAKAWADASLHCSPQSFNRWSLEIYGTGPFSSCFDGLPGLTVHGFMQPAELFREIAYSKVLIAPSLYEPWGVQIHEATRLGLCVISAYQCGSSVHLVRDKFNGFLVDSRSVNCIRLAMSNIIEGKTSDKAMQYMSANSRALASQFSPSIWAETVLSMTA